MRVYRTSRWGVAATLAIAIALCVAGCGSSRDGAAGRIADSSVPPTLLPPSSIVLTSPATSIAPTTGGGGTTRPAPTSTTVTGTQSLRVTGAVVGTFPPAVYPDSQCDPGTGLSAHAPVTFRGRTLMAQIVQEPTSQSGHDLPVATPSSPAYLAVNDAGGSGLAPTVYTWGPGNGGGQSGGSMTYDAATKSFVFENATWLASPRTSATGTITLDGTISCVTASPNH